MSEKKLLPIKTFKQHIVPLGLTGEELAPIINRIKITYQEWIGAVPKELHKYYHLTDMTDSVHATTQTSRHPELIHYIDRSHITHKDWAKLIIANKHAFQYCDLSSLPPVSWVTILRKFPEYHTLCPCFDKFTEYEWQSLLIKHPHLSKYKVEKG